MSLIYDRDVIAEPEKYYDDAVPRAARAARSATNASAAQAVKQYADMHDEDERAQARERAL